MYVVIEIKEKKICRKIPFALPPLKERPELGCSSLGFQRTAGSSSFNISESKTRQQQFQFYRDFRIKEPLVPVVSNQNMSKNRWFQLFTTKTCQRTGGSHERTGKEPSMVLLAGSSTF
jgi:hypothetical protein